MTSPLDNYPQIRKALYLLQWVASLIMGVLGIILAAQNGGVDHLPGWYATTGLVLTFIWTYTGITAQTNVSDTPTPGENGSADSLLAGIIGVVGLVMIATIMGLPLWYGIAIMAALATGLLLYIAHLKDTRNTATG